jgi:hypothetical protein
MALGADCLLLNGCLGLFTCELSGQGIKMTTHVHLELRLGLSTATPLLPLDAFKALATSLPAD